MTAPTEVTRQFHADTEGCFYVIEKQHDGFHWIWVEPEDADASDHAYPSISEALDAAAQDWYDAGSGGKLTTRLRQSAAQYRRKGDPA